MNEKVFKFKHSKLGQLHAAATSDGEDFFCLIDACRILGLQAKRAIEKCDAAHMRKFFIGTNGGRQIANFIDDISLGRLLRISKSCDKHEFAEWLRSKVVPALEDNRPKASEPSLGFLVAVVAVGNIDQILSALKNG